MTRRTKSEWRTLIEAQAQSGKTAAAFCREQGINAKYFSLRRRQLSERPAQRAPSFVPMTLTRSVSVEKLTLSDSGGARVEFPLSIEPLWLAQLLRALRD